MTTENAIDWGIQYLEGLHTSGTRVHNRLLRHRVDHPPEPGGLLSKPLPPLLPYKQAAEAMRGLKQTAALILARLDLEAKEREQFPCAAYREDLRVALCATFK